MTSSGSAALQQFWDAFNFNALSLFALISVAVLTIAVIEQEVLRAARPEVRRRSGRVFAVVIYPLALLTFAVIVARFVRLA